MPVRTHDIFADVVSTFGNSCNGFVARLLEAQVTGALPVAMGPALRQCPGQWRQKFPATHSQSLEHRPLIVEIGCHSGHTLCDMAEQHPEAFFLGLDITFKRVVQAAERAEKRKLKNVFVALANAAGIADLFHPGEVDGIVTFFPDPWSKKKHAHHRLYSPKFLEIAKTIIKSNGFLWLKTDQEFYFSDACQFALNAGLVEVTSVPTFLDEDYSSLFLRRFELKGQEYFARKWLNSKNKIFDTHVPDAPSESSC